jgi:hypothetical protein
MKCNKFTSTSFIKVLACTAVALGAISLAHAAAPVDPTGTWTWVTAGRGGGPGATNTLVLKMDAGKLTGTLTSPAMGGRGNRRGAPPAAGADANAAPATPPAAPPPTVTPITNVKVDGDTISFDVVRSMRGTDITTPYKGKISGDTITGTITMPARGGGDPTPMDWTAKKQK